MPNEFKVKNGLIVDQGGINATGSFLYSGSINVLGNQVTTGSLIISSSNTDQLQIGSNLLFVRTSNVIIGSGSFTYGSAANSGGKLTIVNTTGGNNGLVISNGDGGYQFGITTVTNDQIGTRFTWFDGGSATFLQYAGNLGTRLGNLVAGTAISGSTIIFSNPAGNIMFITSSRVGINKTTPNASLDVNGNAIITGSLTVTTGSFTVITGSGIEFQVTDTGTKIGNLITDTHALTGSLNVSGSITSSLFGTASWANNAITASFATNAGLLNNTSSTVFATTGSNTFRGNQTVTGSLFTSGSNTLVGSTSLSGSVNISGSTIIDGTTTFRNASTTITGSLLVSGSTTQIGNNTLTGNTTLTGSITISGSSGPGATTASVQIYGDIRQTGYHRFDPVNTNIDNSISASYIYVSGSTNDLYFSQNGAGYANTTRLRWLEGNLYTGLLNGGIISASIGSTTYTVGSGSGIIVTINASYGNNPYPTVQYINWPNLTASIAPLSASYDQQFVAILSDGTIGAQGTPYNDGDYNTKIPIGIVIHQNRSTINAAQTFPGVAYGWKQRSFDFIKAFGPLKISGYTLAPSGSSTRGLVLSGGTAWVDGRNYIVDPNNPSYINEASGIVTSKIYRYRQSGSDWVYDTNAGVGYTSIDPTQYSLNGVLTPVDTNKWSIQRVFYFPNSATKAFYIYYGNAQYANQSDALAAISTETFSEAPNTAANAIYAGYMILRHDADFTTPATYTIYQTGLFRGSGGAGGTGGGGGATTLASLSDVLISSVSSGQALVYNSTTTKWENKSFISASISGNASSASFASTSSIATTASFATTAANATSASFASTAANATSASFASTASFAPLYVLNSQTSSFVLNSQTSSMTVATSSFATSSLSSSFAATASSADNFTVRGTLTAQTIVVQTITSSTDFVTGSTRFGSIITNTHQFTGSVSVSGSLALNGNNVITANQTGSMSVATASFATSSLSASFAATASIATSASFATQAANATSASFATNAANATSASFASTASFAPLYVLNSQTSSMTVATASFATSSLSASFATQAVNATSASFATQAANATSASFASTASFAPLYVLNSQTSSFVQNNQTSSFVLNNQTSSMTVATASFATSSLSASFAATASLAPLYVLTSATSSMLAPYLLVSQTSSFVTNAQTSSFVTNAQTSSFVTNAQTSSMTVATASFATSSLSASFAATASSADNFTVRGTLTAQTIVVQTITSSTDFVTGSSRFGSIITNTHQFTGSVSISGSLTVNGNSVVTSNQTSSFVLNSQTSSMTVATASFATSSLSSSYAANGGVTQITAGTNVTISPTSGLGNVTINATAGAAFPFTGSALITGSLTVTGSTTSTLGFTGSLLGTASFASTASFINTLAQNVAISGSLTIITGSGIEFQVTNTGTKIGNIITDTHTITGSLSASGSITATNFTGSLLGTASLATTASFYQIVTGTSGSDVNIATTPSGSVLNIPNASTTARGLFTAGLQTLGGTKIFQFDNAQTGLSNLVLSGSSTVGFRMGVYGTSLPTLTANDNYGSVIIGTSNVNEASSGTHNIISNLAVKTLNISDGTATTTNAATLYIEGAAIGTATPTNNYALWVNSGSVKLDGNALISGSLQVTGSINTIGGFTGSHFGTSSWATSASFAISASWAPGGGSSTITIADEGITQGTATYLNFIGSGVTATVSANTGSITISGGGGLSTKSNAVVSGSFTGNPKKATITFTSAFANTNYGITVTGEDARSWTIESKTTSGFVINSNSNTALAGTTYWHAIAYGEA